MRLAAGLKPSLVALWLVVRVSAAASHEATHITPPPQPPLAMITAESLGDFQAAFNAAADRTRVLALLSPT